MNTADWLSVGRKIADVAPMLGTALGGPAGTILGALVASTLGTGGSPEAVMNAIVADPDAALKLKELEQREDESLRGHLLAMAQNATDLAKAEMADTQNARAEHKDHWMPATLTVILALMVGVMAWGVMTHVVPPESKEVTFFIVGQIMTAFLTACAFWLGSSRSSQVANKVIREKL